MQRPALARPIGSFAIGLVLGTLGSSLFDSPLFAATPTGGTLNAPPAGGTSTVTWSGGPYTAVVESPSMCATLGSAGCDTFTLQVNVPATFYAANPNYSVVVQIRWPDSVNDFDLYVYDASGNVVGSSTGGAPETSETADCGQLPAGTYTVQVVAFAVVNESYTGSGSIMQEPTTPSGRGRYRTGTFTFSSPLALTAPADLLFNAQELEPRAAYDGLGNIYVATIQGTPAGTDMFKSMDGGKSFTYLGQPDGTQAAATVARGAGFGGGDEDIAIDANGRVYMISLWGDPVVGIPLAITSCNSTDGGVTWTANPISQTTPIVDRQWIAVAENNTVYMTFKQEGDALTGGTPSIFFEKSFDGGVTFPQITEVTRPVLGIQPGFEGNVAVDPNNGNVYLTFISTNPNQLYLARSTDGGQSFIIGLIFTAPSNINLSHVFPVIAVDRGSGLHVAFSDGQSVFLTSSKDLGNTWTPPVRVSNGSNTKTTVFPWLSAGDYGKADLVWLGTSASSELDTSAKWQLFMAQTQNAFSSVPTFFQTAATNVMHTGPICTSGSACPSGTRNLADYFTDTVYFDGNALIVYPSDQQVSPPLTYFIKQTSGTIVTGSK